MDSSGVAKINRHIDRYIGNIINLSATKPMQVKKNAKSRRRLRVRQELHHTKGGLSTQCQREGRSDNSRR